MSMCNVLAVVGEESSQTQATLSAAIELADRENARLTLAKVFVSAGAYVWAMPFGSCAAYVDTGLESPEQACRTLARIAEGVPHWIPVTTLVLDQAPKKPLLKLVAAGNFGAVVAEPRLLRCRRLRRLLALEGVLAVPVVVGAVAAEAAPAPAAPGGEPGDGASPPVSPFGGYLAAGSPVPIR